MVNLLTGYCRNSSSLEESEAVGDGGGFCWTVDVFSLKMGETQFHRYRRVSFTVFDMYVKRQGHIILAQSPMCDDCKKKDVYGSNRVLNSRTVVLHL